MSKRTILAALASVALLAACDKSKEDEVIPVSFSSFGFYAKDNAGVLKTDYIEENVNSDVISFTLPYGTDPDALKTLVPEFTVTEGASVNVADASGAPDGKDIVSGSTPVDCSSDVQLVVFLKNNYKAYTLSVKVAEPEKWEKLAMTSLNVEATPALAVNPKDGVPYVAGTSPNKNGEPAPHLFKLAGTELKDVAGALAIARADGVSLSFDPTGVPYVAFADGAFTNKYSVKRVADGKGTYVGEGGQMFGTTAKRSLNSVSAVFPISEKDVWCAHYNNTNTVAVPMGGLNLAHYDGSGWNNGVAIAGREPASYANGVFGRTVNGVPYLYVYGTKTSKVPSHISLYKLDGENWTTIFENLEVLGTDGKPVGGYSAFFSDFDIASDGTVYLLFGALFNAAEDFQIGVVKYDPATGKQVIVGGAMTDTTNMNSSTTASMALDSNDVPYVSISYKDGGVMKTAARHIDSNTKTWSELVTLASNSNFSDIVFAEDGTGYIVTRETVGEDTKYVLYSTAK